LAALEAALEAISDADVDALLSVGDIVGYGASPREVMRLVREHVTAAVKGNHDAAVVGEVDTRWFNPFARTAVEWTREQLTREELEWLRDLPLTVHLEDCTVAHGTPEHPERFDYVQCTEDADPSLDRLGDSICFVGHTHVPVTVLRPTDDPGRTSYTIEDDLDLSEINRALINVGSVGQPRDEDPRAAWGLFDSEARRFVLHRVEYEIAREAHRIRKAGLPGVLADRLFLGV